MYGLNGVLLGVPFDVRARRVTGSAVPLVEGVMDSDVRTGAMHFSVSNDGTLVYLSGASGERSTLSWANRNGRSDPLSADALTYSSPRVSPDGTRVAVEVASREGVDIHIYDLTRKTLTRLTSSSSHGRYPLWTPNSQRVVFYSDSDGGGLYSIAADGTGVAARLTTSRAFQIPYSWTDGGKTLLIEQRSSDQIGASDIYVLSLADDPTASPLLQSAAREEQPAVSPDGRWLAYTVREAPDAEIELFVRPFPHADAGRWQIYEWSFTSMVAGREGAVFHFSRAGDLCSIETAPTFRPRNATEMFDLPPFYTSARSRGQWDLAPDRRFLIMNPGEIAMREDSQSRMIVVLHWHEELKRLVPAK